jgi:hypothetical protein
MVHICLFEGFDLVSKQRLITEFYHGFGDSESKRAESIAIATDIN